MDVDRQARALGLPPAMAAALGQQAAATQAEETVEVMPENWPALRVFAACSTQWRRAGMAGVPTGLDYGAVPPVAGMLAIPADADLLDRLRVLEGEALTAMLEKRN